MVLKYTNLAPLSLIINARSPQTFAALTKHLQVVHTFMMTQQSFASGGLAKLRRRAFSGEMLMQTFMHTLVEDLRSQYYSSFSGTFGQDVQHCCCG